MSPAPEALESLAYILSELNTWKIKPVHSTQDLQSFRVLYSKEC